MKNFWSQVRGWFKEAEESSPTKPFVEEWLERTKEEKEDFNSWKLGSECLDLCSLVHSNFLRYQEGERESGDNRITFLSSAKAAGFVFHFPKGEYTLREAQRFMDFLKWKVSGLNYVSQLSDYRLYAKRGKSERIERFYLKPRLALNEQNRVDQMYGNIIIELTIRDEVPIHLKLQSNRYSDRNYVDAYSFEELMQSIFT